jgi:hypothetical protein
MKSEKKGLFLTKLNVSFSFEGFKQRKIKTVINSKCNILSIILGIFTNEMGRACSTNGGEEECM